MTVADRITQPGSARVLQGRDGIKGWIDEVTGRDMTHAVQHRVEDDSGAAFNVACCCPDGTNVLRATVLELEDGSIRRQTVVQVWDEE